MNIQQDFEELLKLLEDNSAKYMIVGGFAVAYHGFPRLTQDIDFFYENSTENSQIIIDCLVKYGFSRSDLSIETFTTFGNIITFGVEPVRVDFISEITGVKFEDAWENKVRGNYGEIEVNFIGRLELLKNKLSTDRPKDKLDAEELSSQ